MEFEVGDIAKHKLTGERYRVKKIERKGDDYNVICRKLDNENREYEKRHFSDMELEKVGDEYREIEYRKGKGVIYGIGAGIALSGLQRILFKDILNQTVIYVSGVKRKRK